MFHYKVVHIKESESFNRAVKTLTNKLELFMSEAVIPLITIFFKFDSAEEYHSKKSSIEKQILKANKDGFVLVFPVQSLIDEVLVGEFFYMDEGWDKQEACLNNFVSYKKNKALTYFYISQNISADEAFNDLDALFRDYALSHTQVIRQWNYIERILDEEEDGQNYQKFNNVRSEIYSDDFQFGYPSATGIGQQCGGVLLAGFGLLDDQLEVKSVRSAVQADAHQYSVQVLVGKDRDELRSPKFERGKILIGSDKAMFFVSGTASIENQQTVYENNPEKQLFKTIENIKILTERAEEMLKWEADMNCMQLRCYVRPGCNVHGLEEVLFNNFQCMPVIVVADICRNDLFVEIECIYKFYRSNGS